MDSAQATIERALARYRSQGLFTHAACAWGVLAEPTPRLCVQLLPDGRDLFDLASLTKALVTTPLIHHRALVDERCHGAPRGSRLWHTLGAWAGDALPELAPELRALTVASLLRHDAGLAAWRNLWVGHLGVETPKLLAEAAARKARLIAMLNRQAAWLAEAKLKEAVYSDVGFLLLGLLLEELGARPLDRQFADFCAELLPETSRDERLVYRPADWGLADRCVPTAWCALRRRLLVGEVHDENAASLGGVAGHAGIFGTLAAVARHVHNLWITADSRSLFTLNAGQRVLPPGSPPNASLLGWRQAADASSETFGGGAAMGHMGFTGVAFWVRPEQEDYAILLTNRVCSGRTRPGIAAARREIFGLLSAHASHALRV